MIDMSTAIYNCPCCGAPLAWSDGKLACASCGNAYEPEQIEELNKSSQSQISFSQSGSE